MCDSCAKLSPEQVERIFADADASRAKRAVDMPTEQDAINVMFSAWQRLKELGWNDAMYCPKDGSWFDALEAGSTGIHDCNYEGEWPSGSWWVASGGDLWPSHPILYRNKEKTNG